MNVLIRLVTRGHYRCGARSSANLDVTARSVKSKALPPWNTNRRGDTVQRTRLTLPSYRSFTSATTCGLAITGALLWMRAKSDVTTWIADPPRTVPGVIWSAPVEVRPGQAVRRQLQGHLVVGVQDRPT